MILLNLYKNFAMKIVALFFMLFVPLNAFAQQGFVMDEGRKKVVIPFQLRSNLIFISLNVNGIDLTFLVDAGVSETLLFSLDEKKELKLDGVEKIQLKGLGSDYAIDALVTKSVKIKLPHLTDNNHTLYIVLDQEINFSPNVGIAVNGIIGYHFFKNFLIDIDYVRKRIVVSRPSEKVKEKLKNYTALPFVLEKNKPYTTINAVFKDEIIPVKVLMDSGSSDAVWLFANRSTKIEVPKKNIPDFLGRGLSGEIYGHKARIKSVKIDRYSFDDPIVAFPDSLFTQNVFSDYNRLGSVGGEVLRRFRQIFDYQNQILYLKPNRFYEEPFLFDKSGIEVQHDGLQWVQEQIELGTQYSGGLSENNSAGEVNSFTYKFELKPIYRIFNVRKGSPADIAGVRQGDIIVSINKKLAHNFTLDQIVKLLTSEENKVIKMQLLRDGRFVSISFQLKVIL